MEQAKRFSNKKLVIICLIIIVIIVSVAIFLIPKSKNEPTVSKVQPGETITSDQIKKQNQNNATGSQKGTTRR
jgi:hypothetical protein